MDLRAREADPGELPFNSARARPFGTAGPGRSRERNVPTEATQKAARVLSVRDFSLLAMFQLAKKAKKGEKIVPSWEEAWSLAACLCCKGQQSWGGVQLLIFSTVKRCWLLDKESRLSTSAGLDAATRLQPFLCKVVSEVLLETRRLWPAVDWAGVGELQSFPGDFGQLGRKTQT